jgi:hypothetical protein
MISGHGQPFLVANLTSNENARGLARCALVSKNQSADAKYDEAWLQHLISTHPEILPIGAIEPALVEPISVCTELRTPSGGYIDNLLVTSRGDLVLIECKLWRNPQARREVVGQIIEYAKDVSKWNYQQLSEAISRSTPPAGVKQSLPLYERIGTPDKLDEALFVDSVSRNLRRGRALLLIVGDGIRENVESMTEFLQQHVGLHFTLALVELAVFEMPANEGFLVSPFVVARTKMIERGVVAMADDRVEVRAPEFPTASNSSQSATLPAKRVAETITEEIFFERLEANQIGTAAKLQAVLDQFSQIGITTEPMTASIKLLGRAADEQWPLGTIQASDASVWFESVAKTANDIGQRDAAIRYYQRLVDLIADESLKLRKAAPATRSGVSSLPLKWLLLKDGAWQAAIEEYLKTIAQAA